MSAVLDFPVKPEARPYLDAFVENASEPQWLRDMRQRNLARFAEQGFPSRRSESWRYIDLQPLQTEPALPAERSPSLTLSAGPSNASPGVWFGSLRRALTERPELARIATDAGGNAQATSALNAALFADGYVLDIAPGAALGQTIEVAHPAPDGGSLHTRSLINLGEGSRATIVETYAGESRYWRNDAVTARLGAGAQLTRIIVVEEAGEAIHTGLFEARLDAGAQLHTVALLLGGSRVRQEWNVCLAGDGAHCRLDAAYIVSGEDEANIVASVDHAAPGGTTRELIKGVAADRGHGAFQGRIIVREHAQKTDAHQLSRNIMLGRRAVIDAKPELEILADDVKCSHGASVGDLDEAALFYLRTRGISIEAARRMLIEGFLREVTDGGVDAAVRDHLLTRLGQRLARLEG
jgi:Fe-S cluster assembly protein SufD